MTPEEDVRQVRALRAQVQPAEIAPSRVMRRTLSRVDEHFVQAAVNAVGASGVIQAALGRTDEDLRREIDESARWTAVIDEIRSLLKEAVVSNAARRNPEPPADVKPAAK